MAIKGKSVNRTDLAAIFGVSMPTVDRWVVNGMPVVKQGSRGVSAEFNTAECFEWLRNTAVDEATGKVLADDATIDRRMKTAKMVRAELDLEKEKGTLAPVAQMQTMLANVLANLRAKMRIIPSRAYGALVGEDDETKFKQTLMQEIDTALIECSRASLTDEPLPEGEEDAT
jgi:phage terminase Nu1 subunit (DNA packaging protein)